MVRAVSKHWNPEKPTPELNTAKKTSKIRRDPVPVEPQKPASLDKALWRQSQEWEIGIAILGMILFALGIDAASYLFAGFISH